MALSNSKPGSRRARSADIQATHNALRYSRTQSDQQSTSKRALTPKTRAAARRRTPPPPPQAERIAHLVGAVELVSTFASEDTTTHRAKRTDDQKMPDQISPQRCVYDNNKKNRQATSAREAKEKHRRVAGGKPSPPASLARSPLISPCYFPPY